LTNRYLYDYTLGMKCISDYLEQLKIKKRKIKLTKKGEVHYVEYWSNNGRHGIGLTVIEAKQNFHYHNEEDVPFSLYK